MIDFHTHILPGIDDGSDSVPTSLAMLEQEYRQGIEAVILTPHYYANQFSPGEFLDRRQKAWDSLRKTSGVHIPEMYLGAEVQYFEGICGREDIRELCIEGTNLLLLEMPFTKWTSRTIADVLKLNAQSGMQIVLAHIERYMSMQQESVLEHMRKEGILMQSNISFFARWQTRRKAVKMFSAGEIHFLGSDCHNMGTRAPNWNRLPENVRMMVELNRSNRTLSKLLRESEDAAISGIEESWCL